MHQLYSWFKLSQALEKWKINSGINTVFENISPVYHYYLLHHVKCIILSTGPSAHNHRLYRGVCQENPSHFHQLLFIWTPLLWKWFPMGIIWLLEWCHNIQHVFAGEDGLQGCGVAVAAAGAAPSSWNHCPSLRSSLVTEYPFWSSGLHNVDNGKVGERTKHLKRSRAVRVVNTGCHYH